MTRLGRDSAVFLFVVPSVICALSTGCAGLHFAARDHGVAADPFQSVAAAVATPEDGARASLPDVEEFLVRTQNYRMPGTVSPEPPPATPLPTMPPEAGPRAGPSGPMEQPGTIRRAAPRPDTAFANMQMTLAENAIGQQPPAPPVIESLAVEVSVPVAASVEQPTRINTTNQPLELHPEVTSMPTDRFLKHLEVLAAEAKDFASEWQLRLTQAALNREGEAVKVSSSLSRDARSILSGLIRLAAAARRVAADPLLPGDEALECLDDLRRVLTDRADPIVSTVALCSKVVTFGVYDELSTDDLVAGRSIPAIVYSEIRNLRSEQTDDGQYRSVLATRLEVLTAAGESVWEHEEPEIVDQCRRPRIDFFLAHRIAFPPTLAPGNYVLKLLVEDKLSGKANEFAYQFAIPAVTSVAANR